MEVSARIEEIGESESSLIGHTGHSALNGWPHKSALNHNNPSQKSMIIYIGYTQVVAV